MSTPNIYAYYSKQSGGGYSVMLVNADPSNAYTIPTSSLGITSTAETEYAYSAANPTVATSSFSGTSVSVPAESIVVLANGSGTQPTPTPIPTPTTTTPTPTPTSTGKACAATWSLTNSWSGGFQLGFTVTNSGTAATTGWTVKYSWPGSQAITQIWNATESQSGAAVTIGDLSYDAAIPVNGSTTFGLLGNGTAASTLSSLTCTAT